MSSSSTPLETEARFPINFDLSELEALAQEAEAKHGTDNGNNWSIMDLSDFRHQLLFESTTRPIPTEKGQLQQLRLTTQIPHQDYFKLIWDYIEKQDITRIQILTLYSIESLDQLYAESFLTFLRKVAAQCQVTEFRILSKVCSLGYAPPDQTQNLVRVLEEFPAFDWIYFPMSEISEGTNNANVKIKIGDLQNLVGKTKQGLILYGNENQEALIRSELRKPIPNKIFPIPLQSTDATNDMTVEQWKPVPVSPLKRSRPETTTYGESKAAAFFPSSVNSTSPHIPSNASASDEESGKKAKGSDGQAIPIPHATSSSSTSTSSPAPPGPTLAVSSSSSSSALVTAPLSPQTVLESTILPTTVQLADWKSGVDAQVPLRNNFMPEGVHVLWTRLVENPPSFLRRGQGVRIAILDSGCDMEVLPHFKVPDVDTATFVTGDLRQVRVDHEGHGTACAYLARAVAPDAQFLIGKVYPGDNLAAAIRWAIRREAKIINLSIALNQYDSVVRSLINEAINKGVIVICSASNYGQIGVKPVAFPARLGNVIVVGSHDPMNRMNNFSSVGKEVHYLAPGSGYAIPRSRYEERYSPKNGAWRMAEGTSFASPLVCGLVAVIMSSMIKQNEKAAELSNRFQAPCDLAHFDNEMVKNLLDLVASSPHGSQNAVDCIDLDLLLESEECLLHLQRAYLKFRGIPDTFRYTRN